MSEVDKILDSLALLQEFSLAQAGDEVAKEALLRRENLPEKMKAALTKAKPKEIPKITKRYGTPVREEYTTDEEFNKAKAEYSEFVNDLKKALEEPLGAAIKKSLVVAPATNTPEPIDYEALLRDANESRSFKELLHKEGIQL